MRLVCPKCDAQYEVTDDAIPANGRDVQCANCGDTWFQERKRPSLRKERPAPVVEDQDEAETPPPPRPSLRREPVDEPDDDEDNEDDDEGSPSPAHDLAAPKVDPSVLDILRSEAERESAAREAEHDQPQTGASQHYEDEDDGQPAVPTPQRPPISAPDTLADRARASREQLTSHRGTGRRIHFTSDPSEDDENEPEAEDYEDDHDTAGVVAAAVKRAERPRAELPDVDELNSSLRSSRDTRRDGTQPQPAARAARGQGRASGRFGFYLAILIMLLAVAVYALNGPIAAAVPAAEPFVQAYVAGVDSLRRGLADLASMAIDALRELLKRFL